MLVCIFFYQCLNNVSRNIVIPYIQYHMWWWPGDRAWACMSQLLDVFLHPLGKCWLVFLLIVPLFLLTVLNRNWKIGYTTHCSYLKQSLLLQLDAGTMMSWEKISQHIRHQTVWLWILMTYSIYISWELSIMTTIKCIVLHTPSVNILLLFFGYTL